MAAPAVGTGTLLRLNALSSGGDPVLSVYLDLTAARFPRPAARDAELQALIAGTGRHAEETDVKRVREMLHSMVGFAYGARGLAMFSSARGSAHEAVPLPSPVEPMAVVDTTPWLEPLAAMFTPGDWGVAVLGRPAARLFRGGSRALVEFARFEEERHRAPANGDSRRTRRRRIEEQSAEHARQLAGRLLRAHRRQAFDQLVVIAPSGLLTLMEATLHSDLRDRLAGLVTSTSGTRLHGRSYARSPRSVRRAQQDGTTRSQRASRRVLPTAGAAVATHRAASQLHLPRTRRSARSGDQPTRSTRLRAPCSGQEEEAACP
jgi:hypothetical protein